MCSGSKLGGGLSWRLSRLLVAAAAGVAFSCDDAPPRAMGPGGHPDDLHRGLPERPRASPSAIAGPGAALDLEPTAPPDPVSLASAGDLADDLARFTTLDACVAAHGFKDPLLTDSLHALGYDTFARDACRVLAAAKARDPHLCDPIDASALRDRCRAVTAMVNGAPEFCPFLSDLRPALGREPGCLAVAARDPRPCADATTDVTSPGAARVLCEALARGSDDPCRAEHEPIRSACFRERARWKNVLARANDGASGRHAIAGALHVLFVQRAPGGSEADASLETATEVPLDVERGVVVSFDALRRAHVEITARAGGDGRNGARLGLGLPGEASLRVALTPRGDPARPDTAYEGTIEALRVGALAPAGDPLGQALPVGCNVQVDAFEAHRGGRVALNFDGCTLTRKVSGGALVKGAPTGPTVRGELDTFVRDVVDEARDPGRLPKP